MVSLCFYFQQLLKLEDHYVCWLMYGEEFKPHLNSWSKKCCNKITDSELITSFYSILRARCRNFFYNFLFSASYSSAWIDMTRFSY